MQKKTKLKAVTSKSFFRDNIPHIIAHRGRGGRISANKEENTLNCFLETYANGIEHLETDAVLTKDNEVVLFHGSNNFLEAIRTGIPSRRYIETRTYNQLKEAEDARISNIPLLRDVLLSLPSARFSIDAKTNRVVPLLVEQVIQCGAEDRVCLGSFSFGRVKKLKEYSKGIMASAYCIHPRMKIFILLLNKYFFWGVQKSHIECVHLPQTLASKRIIKGAHRQGLAVYIWTVNDQNRAKKYFGIGANGVITDKAVQLHRELM